MVINTILDPNKYFNIHFNDLTILTRSTVPPIDLSAELIDQQAPILSLPPELIVRLYCLMQDPKDLTSLMKVSKKFYFVLTNHPQIWTILLQHNFPGAQLSNHNQFTIAQQVKIIFQTIYPRNKKIDAEIKESYKAISRIQAVLKKLYPDREFPTYDDPVIQNQVEMIEQAMDEVETHDSTIELTMDQNTLMLTLARNQSWDSISALTREQLFLNDPANIQIWIGKIAAQTNSNSYDPNKKLKV
jgi:hypothetical protein